MQKTISIFLVILFVLSEFISSNSFANTSTYSFYSSITGCYVIAILLLIYKYKVQILDLHFSGFLFLIFLFLAIANGAFTKSLSPEWIISGFSLLVFYMLTKRIRLKTEWIFIGIAILGVIQSTFGLAQYVNWSNSSINSFRINGTFDNPAGFAAALSVCFPFALYLLVRKELYWKIIGGFAALLFVVAVVLSQSRAGVIAILVIGGIWVVKVLNPTWLNHWSNRTKIVGSAVLIIAIMIGLYFLKKESADGRLFIWQCSARMIADKPILGHGVGGFQREYMLYQADYFRTHPASSYVMRADIVKHPFNEFVLLLVEHGLVGGLLFGLLVYLLIREYRKSKQLETFYAMLCLSGIGVFACFSYPLGYPFVRLMAVFCAATIMHRETKAWKIPKGLFSIIKPAVLVVLVALLVLTCTMFYNEYRWNVIAQRSLAGETKAVMPDFAILYKTMNRNGLFLYNYGSELNYIGEWNKSTAMLNECANFYNDIDLQLQLADNYTQLKQYRKAEKCFLLAHQMMPNRFIPLYRLALLYKEEGKIHEAHKIAEIIVKKQVKVESIDVMALKEGMNKLILSN